MQPIDDKSKAKAIKLYKQSLTIQEISNLTDISIPTLSKIFRNAFESGELEPRNKDRACKPRTPNGQGKPKYVVSGIGKGGRQKEKKKFNAEQEQEIAIDYYENNLSVSQLKAKWNIHPVQLQRIRKQYQDVYGIKSNAPNYYKNKYNCGK